MKQDVRKYARIDLFEKALIEQRDKATKYRTLCDITRLLELLKYCPMENARPLTNGKWQIIEGAYQCSECGKVYAVKMNYCGSCGSRNESH